MLQIRWPGVRGAVRPGLPGEAPHRFLRSEDSDLAPGTTGVRLEAREGSLGRFPSAQRGRKDSPEGALFP